MKRELESIIMERLKKGYCPVHVGEEDLNEIRLNEKLEDLSKELNRYEAIFDRIEEYEKSKKNRWGVKKE